MPHKGSIKYLIAAVGSGIAAAIFLIISLAAFASHLPISGVLGIVATAAALAGCLAFYRARSEGGAALSPVKYQHKKLSWKELGKLGCVAGVIFFIAQCCAFTLGVQPEPLTQTSSEKQLNISYPASWEFKTASSLNDVDFGSSERAIYVVSIDRGLSIWDSLSFADREQDLANAIGDKKSGISYEQVQSGNFQGVRTGACTMSTDGTPNVSAKAEVIGAGSAEYLLVAAVTSSSEQAADSATADAILDSINIQPSQITATFQDDNGNVLQTVQGDDYGFGAIVTAPDNPTKDGYLFNGWNLEGTSDVPVQQPNDGCYQIAHATNGSVYTPSWTVLHTVVFSDGDGTTIDTQSVKDGDAAKAPSDPKLDGYEFAGWDADYSDVTSDLTVTALWNKLWTVTFTDGMGNTIDSQTVANGKGATAPKKTPTRDGYDFNGWDTDYSSVTSDLTVAATWKAKPTVAQTNAVKKAQSYLDYTSFSYKGLIDQLEFEGFSKDDATYGADNCGADWMVQAEKKAASYMKYTSISRSGLIGQLEFEGFTSEQARHGADSVGL